MLLIRSAKHRQRIKGKTSKGPSRDSAPEHCQCGSELDYTEEKYEHISTELFFIHVNLPWNVLVTT